MINWNNGKPILEIGLGDDEKHHPNYDMIKMLNPVPNMKAQLFIPPADIKGVRTIVDKSIAGFEVEAEVRDMEGNIRHDLKAGVQYWVVIRPKCKLIEPMKMNEIAAQVREELLEWDE